MLTLLATTGFLMIVSILVLSVGVFWDMGTGFEVKAAHRTAVVGIVMTLVSVTLFAAVSFAVMVMDINGVKL